MGGVPILLVNHSLGPGGAERQLVETALHLRQFGYSPHVASVAGGFGEARLQDAGIPVWRIPLTSYVKPSLAAAIAHARAYIRSNDIRLVHAFDFSLCLFAVLAARASGRIGLTSQRFYMDTVPPNYQRMLRLAHRWAHGIVVNCDALTVYLENGYGIKPEKIHTCHNGLEASRFPSGIRKLFPEVAGAELVIGTICVMRPEKDVGTLIEAFAAAAIRGARLLLVGSGPESESLRAHAERLGIASRTTFLPTTQDVASALNSIDISVHPSLSEGLPNSVMEAMATGRAVVATRVGGCPELIDDDKDGLLFEPRDVAALCSALKRLAADAELRTRLGTAAATRIRTHFSLDAAARRMSEIYSRHLR